MIKGLTPRLYQETILGTCTKDNTLVVLPTGLGKTMITMMMAAHRLKIYPQSKILFLAPTKPLVEQHFRTFSTHFEISPDEMAVFTGATSPTKRGALWKEKNIIFSTPQGLENDVISNRIDLSQVSLLVFDEAHRAVGDYAYVFLAEAYQKRASYPRILGLTASPGSDKAKILEVCENLRISAVEIRTADDPDVKPYIQETTVHWVEVSLPEEMMAIKKLLDACYTEKMQIVRQKGYASSVHLSKVDVLKLQRMLFLKGSREKDYEAMKALSLVAEALKVQHALELIETQGIGPLIAYMKKLQTQAEKTTVKAVKNLVIDPNFKAALVKAESARASGVEHPKFARLLEMIQDIVSQEGQKVLVFSQFRDTASAIVELLTSQSIGASLFVGQTKKGTTGMSQKKQAEVLDQFRNGDFPILVATSVAEEGLDIPAVNSVLFYEPVPSAIRTIQRRGRTGRHSEGAVHVLLTKGTRDEGYRWSAFHKEKRMIRILKNLRSSLDLSSMKQQSSLKQFEKKKKWMVYVDHREKGSSVVKELLKADADIQLHQLTSGDFLVSERVGIEYKTQGDFLQSLIDGRLLEQAKYLRMNFSRPLMVIEGTEDLFSLRRIHENAIRGAIASIVSDFGIPIIFTRDHAETASYVLTIARREQEKGWTPVASGERTPRDFTEQQEHVISSFPGIGPTLSKPLLKEFKSVHGVVNASEDDLQKVKLIGKKKAAQFYDLVRKEYKGED